MLNSCNNQIAGSNVQSGRGTAGALSHEVIPAFWYMKWFKWRNTRWGAYTFAALSAVLFFVILEHIGGIFSGLGRFIGFFAPVLYGLIIAYILDFFGFFGHPCG
jgi:hypothetical protein